MSDCDPMELFHAGDNVTGVPRSVARCPECGSTLFVESEAWDSVTGQPTRYGLQVVCDREQHEITEMLARQCDGLAVGDYDAIRHRYAQSDWQPVIDAVAEWAGAVE